MREKIKCLDGPMEDTNAYLDRRLMKLYDKTIIEDKYGNKYLYEIRNNGLKFVRNA